VAATNSIFKGRWALWVLALVFALVAMLGTLTIVGSIAQRVKYFVVNADVAARTQITSANVVAVEVPADAIPPLALSEADVASGQYYSAIALKAGSTLMSSVVTDGLTALDSELPPGYVMASLLVSPENAVGGRIKRGDYVDIAAINGSDTQTAKVVLHHILVLAVTVSPDSVATAANSSGASGASAGSSKTSTSPGPDNAQLYGGIPQMYTFSVTPAEMTKLALVRTASPYLALTDPTAVTPLDSQTDSSGLFAAGAVNASGDLTAANAAGASNAKVAVESFYQAHSAAGDHLKVVGSDLVAYSAATNSEVGKVSLSGGTIDLTSGTYTPAK
jgi:Flp pilus assembly protein CpaB